MIEERFAEVPANDGVLRPSALRVHAEGEMAECIREFAWERTSVGPMARWPESFLCAVNLMLESQFPTVLLWGPELVVMYNDAYQPLMAEKHPAGLGRAAADCWREAWHLIGPRFAAVMRRGERFYFENNLVPVTRQGVLKDVYWTYSYSPVRDTAGRVSGVLVVCHDVTEKLAAERERDALAANLKNVLESTTDGLATLDKDWRYSYMNEQGARMVGLRPADLIGNSLWELFPEAEENEFGREYRLAVETGKPRHFDSYYPEPLNVWLECHCYPTEHGLSVYFRNVTEQKVTEKALRLSESRFRKLFESDLMGIGIPDRFGGFRDCNEGLLRLTGYTRADQDAGLVRWDTMTPTEYAEVDAAHIKEALERGSCTPYEKEFIRKDGTRVPILCGYALLEESGDEFIGFALDLSRQKEVERELREREERFRVLAESMPPMIWMSNGDGENIYCNRRARDYFGVDEAAMMGFGWRKFLHPEDTAKTDAIWARCFETAEPYVDELRLRRKDGVYRHFLARAVPIRNEAGECERWIGSATDVHDQKLAEAALRKSEKLATAGRLAASIAHEINNPLAGVTNALYLALQDESLGVETKGYLKMAEQELRRVSHMTTQTLQFHKQTNLPARVDVSDVVGSVLELFAGRLASKNIVVNAECEPGAFATCFGDEIRQVVANLVSNAMDAMPEGGRLRVRVRRSRGWAKGWVEGVKIAVADTGYGIATTVLEHIFEPFVTTKEATGIGLGLWVSDEIVRKHGGWIRVRSLSEGRVSGTAFAIFIPADAEVAKR
ncbi:PAS domain S-box protein [Granulicella sp. L46]|uniref:PAS domain-containing sensor histidine kinase n=1 Tax=Granulicella sp. L46 TaxID=1641865 RepID=UPI00131CF900|nr:PAS domain S-box protein [Granulicella sp. L46]